MNLREIGSYVGKAANALRKSRKAIAVGLLAYVAVGPLTNLGIRAQAYHVDNQFLTNNQATMSPQFRSKLEGEIQKLETEIYSPMLLIPGDVLMRPFPEDPDS